jgi:hypothetical protein
MTLIEAYTKKHISDIKDTEDTIDREYHQRLIRVDSRQKLIDLLNDYEEFLPEGLLKFRNADEVTCMKLMAMVHRHIHHARRGQVLAEPTEAAALFAPPMLSYPRMIARQYGQATNQYITWGQAFLKLSNEGLITKLIQTQEYMYRRVIEIKEQVQEMIDTKWEPDSPNAPKNPDDNAI